MNVMELLGKTKVKVKDEKVVETSQPLIEWCPIFDKVQGIKRITEESAAANMEFRMKEHGMFTSKRKLEMGVFVGFGASEVMMTAISIGLIEAAVTVCDGAGTVVSSNPNLIQGMGGWISGLIKTDPIPEILEEIKVRGGIVLDPKTASIDQVKGAEEAARKYARFAVTVADADTSERLRQLERDQNVEILIIGVHLSGISKEDAERLLSTADIVTACASKQIRDLANPLIQVGTAVPLFGLTKWGKEVLVERAKEVNQPLLINTMPLPVLPEHKQPRPLI
ncbi:MAG: methanogenesis marker 8 protein [Methanotrichaceae archaeon]